MSVVSAFPPQPRSSCQRGGTQHGVGEIRAESALTHLGKWAQHTTRGGGVSGPETLPPRTPAFSSLPPTPTVPKGLSFPLPEPSRESSVGSDSRGGLGRASPGWGQSPCGRGRPEAHTPRHTACLYGEQARFLDASLKYKGVWEVSYPRINKGLTRKWVSMQERIQG